MNCYYFQDLISLGLILVIKYIQDASDDFYKEYFTISPTVTYDYVWVKEISVDGSTNPSSNITSLNAQNFKLSIT